jgi:C4-dicarboxylate transporter DctM subunit
MITTLMFGSTVLGHFIAATAIPMAAADWIVSLPIPPVVIIVLICFVYLIGGSIIDDMAFVILATPIFFPAVQKLGFDPIWFLITIAIVVATGVVIPPVAMNVFIVKNMTKESLGLIYSGVYPFLASLIFCAVLVFIFPQIITWLPYALGK